jgi:hypothetical protein
MFTPKISRDGCIRMPHATGLIGAREAARTCLVRGGRAWRGGPRCCPLRHATAALNRWRSSLWQPTRADRGVGANVADLGGRAAGCGLAALVASWRWHRHLAARPGALLSRLAAGRHSPLAHHGSDRGDTARAPLAALGVRRRVACGRPSSRARSANTVRAPASHDLWRVGAGCSGRARTSAAENFRRAPTPGAAI